MKPINLRYTQLHISAALGASGAAFGSSRVFNLLEYSGFLTDFWGASGQRRSEPFQTRPRGGVAPRQRLCCCWQPVPFVAAVLVQHITRYLRRPTSMHWNTHATGKYCCTMHAHQCRQLPPPPKKGTILNIHPNPQPCRKQGGVKSTVYPWQGSSGSSLVQMLSFYCSSLVFHGRFGQWFASPLAAALMMVHHL